MLPLEKLEVEVEPLWEDDRLSRLLELSTDRDFGASWVSRKNTKINSDSQTLSILHVISIIYMYFLY